MNHFCKNLSSEELEALFSNYLINSWSYSKVSAFTRNQKVFEMEAIFGLKSKRGPSSIAGNGYHQALAYFFSQLRDGELVELPALEQAAFEEVASVPANQWKLGKTTPTMEQAVPKALEDATKLLRNFYGEKGVYLDDMEEILGVEQYFDEFLSVNGVDIPLPCHGLVDLAMRMKDGKVVIIDHKSKSAYTDDDEAAMVIGMQAITYTLGFEALTGIRVDEVWFPENKPSQNKDKSAQIKPIVTVMDDNARKLYELLLYEGLREMLSAVKDPDHVYTINTADRFADMAEVFDFWMRTQICEVEDFNVDEGKRDLVAKRLKKIRDSSTTMISPQIIKSFQQKIASFIKYDLSKTDMSAQQKIEHVLLAAGIKATVAHSFEGYSSNTFLLEVGAGVRPEAIKKYRLSLANGLDVENVRFSENLVRHENKSYVSVEVAKLREKDLIYAPGDLQGFRIPLGRDNYDNVVHWDLHNQSTPHMLVCGATGSGKSVFLYSTIAYSKKAGVKNIIILDPKFEFRHLRGEGVEVLNDVTEIEEALTLCVKEMNERVESGKSELTLIVFDEYADAIARAKSGNELKIYSRVYVGNYADGSPKYERKQTGEHVSLGENLAQLLQKGRSAGFRIIAAAQRADVKVIPGNAKNNLPIQVCFRVQKAVDSMVVLDEEGAESLAGKGDGLLRSPEYNSTIRFQAYYKPQTQPA